MTPEQSIRAAALAAASRTVPATRGLREVVELAEALAEWITTGQLPAPPRGVLW